MVKEHLVNLKIVEAVEQHECLYNSSNDDYFIKRKINKAWATVAKEVGRSESFCKSKWRNIRIAFIRSLRDYASSKKTKKHKYYLYDALHFLVPHIKCSEQNDSITTSITETDCTSASENEATMDESLNETYKLLEDEFNTDLTETDYPMEESKSKSITPSKCKNNNKEIEAFKIDKMIIECLSNKKKKCENTLDTTKSMVSFLKGLLPDIMSLSVEKQREFKLKIVQLVVELHEE